MTKTDIQTKLVAAQAEFTRVMTKYDGDLENSEVAQALRHLATWELTLELSTREW